MRRLGSSAGKLFLSHGGEPLPVVGARTGCPVPRQDGRRLRLLSYNIQVGVESSGYHDYLLGSWRLFVPHAQRVVNMRRIGDLLQDYDVVGLNEVDAGSLRTNFIGQTGFLAEHAGFPFWYQQINRNFGQIAKHSNGILTRYQPDQVHAHKLPGAPGRGAMFMEFRLGGQRLILALMHLALMKRDRARQLSYIAEVIKDFDHAVVMGDLNCGCQAPELKQLIRNLNLQDLACDDNTFPSWRPIRRLDHILTSAGLTVERPRVLDCGYSDHRPVAADILLPGPLSPGDGGLQG